VKLDLPRPFAGLTFEVLARFTETVIAPFRRAFACRRVDLLPPAGPGREEQDDDGRLVVPLVAEGRVLARVALAGVSPEAATEQTRPLIQALAEAAVEMARLRLAAETDPVTGLANELALAEALTGALARLAPAPAKGSRAMDREPAAPSLSLLAIEPRHMSALLDHHGRNMADRLLREMARQLGETAGRALCLARSGSVFLVLLSGGAGPAGRLASRLRAALESLELSPAGGEPWPLEVVMGAATADSLACSGQLAAEAAAILQARALRALARAGAQGEPGPLFFDEIVETSGRLKQVMPLNKMLIDLGRAHGLAEGERFAVLGPDDDQVKAEVVVVQMDEEESVAELVSLADPTTPPVPGDRLRRLAPETALASEAEPELLVEVAGRPVRVVLDQVTGLASHRSFSALFAELAAADEPFAAALVRADGLEGMRQSLGRVAVDSLMRTLARLASEVLPDSALVGRHSPDTLALLVPGLDTSGAEELCRELARQVREQTERTVSAGVAGHPMVGFAAAEALDSAAAALVHAGFFGPDSVVVFDAVSLNIRGDALFNRGRISEALAEYQRALTIDPAETNVLNSLGVCHGHLGRMEQAIEYFQRAQATAPDDFMAFYNLGYAYLAQGKPGQARQQLEKARELNPEHADTLFQLGRLAQGEGQATAALELFTAAAALPDCRPAVHRHRGEALAALDQAAEAEEAFKKAVKVNPSDAGALSSLAGLYLDRGANLEIALSMARQAMKLEPTSARHARAAGRALTVLGRLDQAAELLQEAAEDHPGDPFLLVQLGRVEMQRDQAVRAKDLFLKALSMEPNLDEARRALVELEDQA